MVLFNKYGVLVDGLALRTRLDIEQAIEILLNGLGPLSQLELKALSDDIQKTVSVRFSEEVLVRAQGIKNKEKLDNVR